MYRKGKVNQDNKLRIIKVFTESDYQGLSRTQKENDYLMIRTGHKDVKQRYSLPSNKESGPDILLRPLS